MGSINLGGWFTDNWFSKLPNQSQIPAFAYMGARKLGRGKKKKKPSSTKPRNPSPSSSPIPPAALGNPLLERYYWEVHARPDYRHTPQVDRIMNEDPLFDPKPDATPEEVEENRKWWEDMRSNPVVEFFRRCDLFWEEKYQEGLADNTTCYRSEDRDMWKELPLVPGPDGRPMPRKSIKTKMQATDKFWDFTRQFIFGLWGFRNLPYPPGRPIDVTQAFGVQKLEDRYYDFIMRSGGWYYKDRLGRTRGPLELTTLKTAWAGGIIDRHTFIWGEDMDEWAPIGMVYGFEKAIATWEVRLAAAATACVHKLQKGISLWTPLKGFEKKTYKQLQDEALESKRRDLAVLEANNGVWPGVKIPSHALFLWASGSDLTKLLEEDYMPNKYIPKDLRYRLAKIIPGLRPWEVLSVEQAMDKITYRGKWYREPLGSFFTAPDYIEEWNSFYLREMELYDRLMDMTISRLRQKVPGFQAVYEMVQKEKSKLPSLFGKGRPRDALFAKG